MDEVRQEQPKREEARPAGNHKRKVTAAIVFAVLAIVGIISIFIYIEYKKTHISTDDAYVEGDIYTVASKVPGTVKALYVDDNQYVKKGTLLVEIDPVDYEVRVREAASSLASEEAKLAEKEAAIESARKLLAEARARRETAKANLDLQEANLRQAQTDLKRAESLFKKDAVSKEKYERQQTALDVSVAQVQAAREQLRQTEMGIESQSAVVKQMEASKAAQSSSVKQKEAALEAAKLNAGYTDIYAPIDGYVTKKSVETGNQIQPAQPLMAVVPLYDVWIVANYKETQLNKVKPGLRAEIEVDTYPGKKFNGKVESIMAGTGAAFSLFPPENATGNYVKVVQRIPVKIVLDKGTDPQHVLRVGMSVVPTILLQ